MTNIRDNLLRVNGDENALLKMLRSGEMISGVIQKVTRPIDMVTQHGDFTSLCCDYMCNLVFKPGTTNDTQYITVKNAFDFDYNSLQSADRVYLNHKERKKFCIDYHENPNTVHLFEICEFPMDNDNDN